MVVGWAAPATGKPAGVSFGQAVLQTEAVTLVLGVHQPNALLDQSARLLSEQTPSWLLMSKRFLLIEIFSDPPREE